MSSVKPGSSPSNSSVVWNFRTLFSNRIWKHPLKKHIIINHSASVAYDDKHVTCMGLCVDWGAGGVQVFSSSYSGHQTGETVMSGVYSFPCRSHKLPEG